MNLTVPTTFTTRFLDTLQQLNRNYQDKAKIFEVYGAFQHGTFSSARPAKYLPQVDRDQFYDHVQQAAERDIKFNYLINSPCYANQEYSADGRQALEELLGFLVESKVTSVTVTVPYLVEIIARRFPQLEIVVSTIAYVDTLRGIDQFVQAGADRIVINVDANRDFTFLETAVRHSPVPIELVANPVCLYQCQYKYNHYAVAGHGSISDGLGCGSPYNQFYLNWCFLQKLATPGDFLRSPWLRPEDLDLWRDSGIHYFKLAGRGQDDDSLTALCNAYMSGRFDGNLLEIMGWPHWQAFRRSADGTVLPELEISIDNQGLDGFLAFFAEKRPNCRQGCQGCGHCDRWAKKVIEYSDDHLRKQYLHNMEQSLTALVEHVPTARESADLSKQWVQAANKQRLP